MENAQIKTITGREIGDGKWMAFAQYDNGVTVAAEQHAGHVLYEAMYGEIWNTRATILGTKFDKRQWGELKELGAQFPNHTTEIVGDTTVHTKLHYEGPEYEAYQARRREILSAYEGTALPWSPEAKEGLRVYAQTHPDPVTRLKQESRAVYDAIMESLDLSPVREPDNIGLKLGCWATLLWPVTFLPALAASKGPLRTDTERIVVAGGLFGPLFGLAGLYRAIVPPVVGQEVGNYEKLQGVVGEDPLIRFIGTTERFEDAILYFPDGKELTPWFGVERKEPFAETEAYEGPDEVHCITVDPALEARLNFALQRWEEDRETHSSFFIDEDALEAALRGAGYIGGSFDGKFPHHAYD